MSAIVVVSQSVAQSREPDRQASSKPVAKHSNNGGKARRNHLDYLEQKLAVIRDRVRGVALGHHTGFYLHGRPGTSKTFTVRTTLEREKIAYCHHTGHLTPMGLFDLLRDNPDAIIVLDDVSQIFKAPIGMQLLLSALGNQPDATGVRVIHYRRQNRVETVFFSGGIIAISNMDLQGNKVAEAIRNRVHCFNYDPTDEQISALILDIAAKGHRFKDCKLPPEDCTDVAKYLLHECRRLGHHPDVRLLVDKAFKDYILWLSGNSENHWKDLVTSAIQERLAEPHHVEHPKTRSDRVAAECRLARDIAAKHQERSERLAAWKEQTNKSERAFYRRLKDVGVAA